MTDKRFVIDKSDSWWDLLDTIEYTRIDGSLHFQDVMEQVCNLLNELHEENEERKRAMRLAEYYNEQLVNQNKKMKKYIDSIRKGGLE